MSKKLSHISIHGAEDSDGVPSAAIIEHFNDGSKSEPFVYDRNDHELHRHVDAALDGESVSYPEGGHDEEPLDQAEFREYKRRRQEQRRK